MKSKNNIIFFGFKGSGKTYFAKRLALRLNRVHIDTDHLVEGEFGSPSYEIVRAIGEKEFRLLENKVIASLASFENSIISLGGGSLLDPQNQTVLLNLGKLIYLDTDVELLKKRILTGPFPSFLDPLDFETSFAKVYQKRKILYESFPALRIKTSGKSDETVLDEILNQL